MLNKKKRGLMVDNKWLEDSNYIRELNFPDIYYLETLCYKIAAFIKNVPVPIHTSYSDGMIKLAIGKELKSFEINTDISYYDMITLIKIWSEKYYPQYEITEQIEVELSEDEIMSEVKKGVSINDALQMTKIATKREKGIIEKVFITEDQFLFNKNGCREIRMSGSIENPMPLSVFMRSIRQFKDDTKEDKNVHISSFIKSNSHTLKVIGDKLSEVVISYSGKQMYNFFVINYPVLKNKEFIKLDEFNYLWANFKIKFESQTLKSDCLNYYYTMKDNEK